MSKNSRKKQVSDRVIETWTFQDAETSRVLVTVRFFKHGEPEISVDPNIRPAQKEASASRFRDVRPDLTHDEAWGFLFS